MITVNVCIGSACHVKGSYNVISTLQELAEEKGLSDSIEIKPVFCMGHCTEAVSVRIGDGEVESVSSRTVRDYFETKVLPLVLAETAQV